MKTELKNKIGDVFYTGEPDDTNQLIENNWIGYVLVEDVMSGANQCLELLQKSNYTKLLNNNTRVVGNWSDANEWIATNWMPRAVGAGLKYFAHIVSSDIFDALSSEELQQNSTGFTMRTFEKVDDAMAWLQSVD